MTMTAHQTDHQLKEAISEELAGTPSVEADEIGVALNDGAATLSGQVGTYPEKEAAVAAALRVRGGAGRSGRDRRPPRRGPTRGC
jgi:osmotically-inducible protein OsmY